MKALLQPLYPCIVSVALLVLVCCGFYPCLVWGVAQGLFRYQADGSLIVSREGTVQGSELLGQSVKSARYFHPRPSAAGEGYDAIRSGGSNLGQTSRKLFESISNQVVQYRAENALERNASVPADAVTASGSGLDPHISRRNAQLQVARIARARGISESLVRDVLDANTEKGLRALFNGSYVNVMTLNRALDKPPGPAAHPAAEAGPLR